MRRRREALRTTLAVVAISLVLLSVPAVATFRTSHTTHRGTTAPSVGQAAPGDHSTATPTAAQDGRSGSRSSQRQRDSDGDGVPNAQDRCPNRPETYNGFKDGDGCPDVVTTTGAS